MTRLTAACRCGKVVFEAADAPIVTVSCYCTSCQQAGHAFEKMPSAPAVLDADGGTPVLLCRKDRVRCIHGREYLVERRLNANSPTRRVFATCCNSAMFADFTKGHWLSLYRNRFGSGAPPVEMRVMTGERPGGAILSQDVPNYPGRPAGLMWKLIAAWAAMGFRRPDMGLAHIPRSDFDGNSFSA
jgi:hypothetical protein